MRIAQKIWSRSRQQAKLAWGDVKHVWGRDVKFYQQARGCRIMLYHGVCNHAPTRFNTLFIDHATFESHLQYYKTYFNVVSLDDYYAGNFSNNKFNICLTFDDGFANNYTYVLPLLTKYQLPATFFVTGIRDAGYDILWNDFLCIAGKVGPQSFTFNDEIYHKGRFNKYHTVAGVSLISHLRNEGFESKAAMICLLDQLVPFQRDRQYEHYWQQMNRTQIRTLSASPFTTLGAHGYYHNDLALIGIKDAANELALSKNYLENIIDKEVTSVAFPYGSYNQELINAAKAAGYKQLLATDFQNDEDGKDPSLRERFTVNPFISAPNQMYASIRGKYE